MRPMIFLPPGQMAKEEIALLRENGICIVIAKDPAKIKFVDPIPASSSRTEMEDAAIKLSRVLLNNDWRKYWNSETLGSSAFAHIYVSLLLKGTALDPQGTREEQEQAIIDRARIAELASIGREEARAEAKARKEVRAKAASEAKP